MFAAVVAVALTFGADRARAADGERPDLHAVWQANAPQPVEGRQPSRFTLAPLVLDEPAARQLAVDGQDLRTWLIEQVRAEGWPVSGVENPLFGQDQSDEARFVLGGAIGEPYEVPRERRDGTAVDVRWELLDRQTNEVVYKVVTRAWRAGAPGGADARTWALELVRLALFNVLARETFLAVLERPTLGASLPTSGLATLRTCPPRVAQLPDGFDQVLPAVVTVQNGNVTGSGVVVSPDGFVVTAAQLVEGADFVQVALHQGPVLQATVLQYDSVHDVALVQVQGSQFACTPIAPARPGVGQPVYVVGAGAAGSVSSGVVSGTRRVDDLELLQTDAVVDATARGGPLLDTQGALVGIVSTRGDRGGPASSVPAAAIEQWLGLRFGARSVVEGPRTASPVARGPVTDPPDPPIAARDAEVCLFRRSGGPSVTFDVGSEPVTIGARQFACVPVPSGTVSVTRPGALPTKYRLRAGDSLVLLVVGKSLSKSVRSELDRARSKGIEDVSPGSAAAGP